MFGCNVSNANNHTRRVFLPNIHDVTIYSDVLSRTLSLKISAAGMRTLDKHGGIDNFLKHTPLRKLESSLHALKRSFLKKQQSV